MQVASNDLVSRFQIERSLHPVSFTSRHNPEIQKDMNLDIWELHVTVGKKPSFFSRLFSRNNDSLLNILLTPLGNYDPNRETFIDADQIYPLIYSSNPIKYPHITNVNQKIEKDELDRLDEFLPLCFVDDVNKNEITKLLSEISLTKETDLIIPIGFSLESGFFFITPTLKPYLTKRDIPHITGDEKNQYYVLFNDGAKLKALHVIEIDKYLDKFDVNYIAKF